MKKNKSLLDLITENPTSFPVNFHLIKPVKKYQGVNERRRIVNVNKYQDNIVVVDDFFKKISRFH